MQITQKIKIIFLIQTLLMSYFDVNCFELEQNLKSSLVLDTNEIELSKNLSYSQALSKGHKFRYKNKIQKALLYYKIALFKTEPNNKDCNFWLGSMYHALGDLRKGFIGWAYQWYENKSFHKNLWTGQNLKDKTILVQSHLAFGDIFQYVRYLDLLKKQYSRVIFKVPKCLINLFQNIPYIDKVLAELPAKFQYDYQIPITALPYFFETDINSIPCEIPYIFADKKLESLWKNEFASDHKFKIGICWHGGPNKDLQYQTRSMPLKKLKPLFEVKNVSIYNLQQGIGLQQISKFIYKDILKSFDQSFDKDHGAFSDTAAVINNLDLVITIDTSIAHLAGALGAKVWVMLPFAAECRFLQNRNDSPWYPTMKLFRQKQYNDWDSVIFEIIAELQVLIKG